ncbi:MAG TPA: hypothetical protein DCG38_01575 [Eubacteriaceae bacterium]|jgi:transcriptional regulator with XRE-family HTH domain|nr:hypothetical protein [Eubacteriaceae bacterium]
MNNDFAGVGERLRHLLKKDKLKQVDVCHAAGISKNAMSNYISGNRVPDTKALYKLSKVFSVSMEWLLTGDENVTTISLGQTEKSMLDLFRGLSQEDREEIIMLIDLKYHRSRRKKSDNK